MRVLKKLFYAFCICIAGAVFIWVGTTDILDTVAFAQRGVVTTVYPASDHYTETTRKGVTTYKMDIAYRHQNGQEVLLRGRQISKADLSAFENGQTIQREYLPDKPQKIRALEEDKMWLTIAFILIGVALVLFGSRSIIRACKPANP